MDELYSGVRLMVYFAKLKPYFVVWDVCVRERGKLWTESSSPGDIAKIWDISISYRGTWLTIDQTN